MTKKPNRNNEDPTEQLTQLKSRMDAAKQQLSKEQGALESAQAALKEMGVEDVEEAEQELDKLVERIAQQEQELALKVEAVRVALEGDGD